MAAKKKSPSTAARSGKASAATPEVAPPAVEVTTTSVPPVTNAPVAKAAPTVSAPPAAPAKAAVSSALVVTPVASIAPVQGESAASLPGLEADVRPMIQMPAPPREMPVLSHDAIARRAHEIHLVRGGTAFDNWLQAERELAGR